VLRGVVGVTDSESDGAGVNFSTTETALMLVSAPAFGPALLAEPDEVAGFDVALGFVERVKPDGRDLGPAAL
jgi:hypothetical protein